MRAKNKVALAVELSIYLFGAVKASDDAFKPSIGVSPSDIRFITWVYLPVL